MSGQQAIATPASLQCVTFSLQNENYGIDVMQVQEVLRQIEVAPVPGAPSFVTGIINLRGNIVSVIDARARFGLPSAEATSLTRTIVIEVHQQIIGIVVDSVAEVIDVNPSDIEVTTNVGNDETSPYITGTVNSDDQLLVMIDLNKLIGDVEIGVTGGI